MLRISSPAFQDNQSIPREYTADGANRSPPLQWAGTPPATRSFALIVDDPDAPDPRAPARTWVHWVVYDIPADTCALPAALRERDFPAGMHAGLNDWQRAAYDGPAPPTGRHRYFHKLYALDVVLPDLAHPTKAQLLRAMKGHVLAESQLIGVYESGR